MLWLGEDYPQGGGGLAPVVSGPSKHDPPLICDGRMAAVGLGSVTEDHILYWSPSPVLPGSYSVDFYAESKNFRRN